MRRLKSVPSNLNDMTNTNYSTMLIRHYSKNSHYLKLIVLLADTYIQLYPHLSCCLCLHLQMCRHEA